MSASIFAVAATVGTRSFPHVPLRIPHASTAVPLKRGLVIPADFDTFLSQSWDAIVTVSVFPRRWPAPNRCAKRDPKTTASWALKMSPSVHEEVIVLMDFPADLNCPSSLRYPRGDWQSTNNLSTELRQSVEAYVLFCRDSCNYETWPCNPQFPWCCSRRWWTAHFICWGSPCCLSWLPLWVDWQPGHETPV